MKKTKEVEKEVVVEAVAKPVLPLPLGITLGREDLDSLVKKLNEIIEYLGKVELKN